MKGNDLSRKVISTPDVHASGCGLYLHQQAMDTTTPSGNAMFQMMGVFAELERCYINSLMAEATLGILALRRNSACTTPDGAA